jgi:predicted nucleic-acid-binding protein
LLRPAVPSDNVDLAQGLAAIRARVAYSGPALATVQMKAAVQREARHGLAPAARGVAQRVTATGSARGRSKPARERPLMAALDNDVLVRLIVGDDLRQARAAEALVASEPCTVAPSVLMECEWVLRAGNGMDAKLIAASMRDFLVLRNIDASDPALTQQVLQAYEAGLDFADALHSAQRREGEGFATFDKLLAKRARKAGVKAVTLLKA